MSLALLAVAGFAQPLLAQTATDAARTRIADLLAEPIAQSNTRSSGPRAEARQAMAECGDPRNARQRDQACTTAQQKYEACRNAIEDWNQRRDALLQGLTPEIVNSDRSLPGRLDALRKAKLDACPGSIPDSLLALQESVKRWEGASSTAPRRPGTTATHTDDDSFTTGLFQQSVNRAQGARPN